MHNHFQYHYHLLALVAATSLTCNTLGQASFDEPFDTPGPTTFPNQGPDNLIAQGWEFADVTYACCNGGNYHYGTYASKPLPPYAGADYLHVISYETAAMWAVLPVIPGQTAGDIIAFQLAGEPGGGSGISVQVRYSPTGGTDVGSNWSEFGDFTEVLASVIDPVTGWNQVTAVVPGDGRLAIRAYGGVCSGCAFEVGIDELTVGDEPPPCETCLPMPSAGETVHWTSAISPVIFTESVTIAEGGTVIVDPGVEVVIEDVTTLTVLGSIEFREGTSLSAELIPGEANHLLVRDTGEARFLGTPTDPITITGGGLYNGAISLAGRAKVYLERTLVEGTLTGEWQFTGEGAPTIHARDCAFTAPALNHLAGTLVLEQCMFDGTWINTEEVYHVFHDLTLQNGAFIETYRRDLGQPIVFDTITASGVSGDAPFQLFGNMHHFGPNNNIFGNNWPVRLSGGLTRDSVIPTSGNNQNVIAMNGASGARVTIPQLAVPYHGLDGIGGGNVDVDPGVVLKMAPGASIGPAGGGLYEFNLRGTPEEPIVMEPLVPGQKWGGLFWSGDGERATTDWIVVDGAERGAHANETTRFWMQNAIFTNCDAGGYSSSLGVGRYRSCRFINNAIGIDTSEGDPVTGLFAGNFDAQSQTNPNSFLGNAIGVRDQSTTATSLAAHCWWGDPSGPQNPANPGGTGDSVVGSVAFMPFLTAPPDSDDHPPSVRFIGLEERAKPGERIILRWQASDDNPIDHFRLEFVEHHGCAGFHYSVFEDNIPGDRRAIVVEIPPYAGGGCYNFNQPAFKIVAIDSAGHEGLHVWDYFLEELSGNPGPEIPVLPQPVRPGDSLPGNPNAYALSVYDDSDLVGYSQGQQTFIEIPPVSTDLARIALRFGGGDRTFGDYFEIRPDPAITGDFPPEITMLSPQDGDSFTFGSSVPITWTASDDQAIRSFEIQVSYDGGREWHRIVTDLDASATSYDFDLPPSDLGIADVRLRVLVRDSTFQVSSDGTNRVISLQPGDGNPAGDLNGDGVVDGSDLGIMLGAFGLNNPNADLNNDGTVDGADLGILLGAWSG